MSFLKQTKKLYSHINNIFFRPKSRRPFFILALVLIVFLFPLAQHALAQAAPTIPSAVTSASSATAGFFANVVSFVVTPVLQVITIFCALFVDLAAHFLGFMLRPDLYNFTTEPIIVDGWKMVRDVCNLFFLLILLFIAFCTILQIEKYHLKKTLLTLIIMALLINFSKPIAIFIFDGAQLLMNYFLGAMGDYGTVVTKLSGIASIIYKDLPSFLNAVQSKGGFTGAAVQYLFAIIFMFMYAVALFVIGIYLLIRIVALWLIVIISPLAFLAMAVPDFKKMSSDWWDALFKYSYVGPAMAFFLWLSTRLASSFFVRMAQSSKTEVTIISMANFISFMTVIVFLYASIIMAQKFGIQFASAITGYADRAMKWGTGLTAAKWGGRKAWQGAKYAGRAGARLADYKILAPLGVSPRALWRGWKEGSAEAERKAMEPAVSSARDRWNKLLGRKEPADYHKNVQFESDVDKYMKEQRTISTEDKALIAVLQKFKGDKSPEAQKRVAAALRLMFENNDQNEFMKQYALVDEDFAKLGLKSNNPDDLRKALTHVLGVGVDASKMSKEQEGQVGRQLHQLGTIALSKGNLGNFGMASFNAKEGQYEINDGRDDKHQQISFAKAKARNIDVQEKMKRMHWNSILEENQDNTPGEIHATGMVLLADMKQSEISQLNRARPDFIENLYKKRDAIRTYAQTGAGLNEDQRNNLEHLVRALEIQYKGVEKGKGRQEGEKGQASAVYSNEYPNPYQ